MATNLKRALVYYRTSTAQQFKKISPDVQKQVCLDSARRENFVVDMIEDIYWDDESAFVGKGSKRDGFQRMTKRWKEGSGVAAIIVYDISRLFRDTRGYLNYTHEMKKAGIELISATESAIRDTSPSGQLPATIIAAVNQYNSEVYGNKIRESLKFKAASGIYPGKAPFGYNNVREEGEGKRRAWIEVNQLEAPWVKRAFELYGQGSETIHSVTAKLIEEGCPTTNGKPLRPSVLERILKDKIYIGHIEWRGEVYKNGKHEKLVDDQTFERVQLVLAAHNKGANRKRKHDFLLRGLAWCASCNSRMQAGYGTGRSGQKYGHYFCSKHQHGKKVECKESYIPVEELNNQFSKLFKYLELSPRAKEKLKEKIERSFGEKQRTFEAMRKGLLSRVDHIRETKKNAFLKFVNAEVDGETYEGAKSELETKETELNNQLSKLEGDLALIMRALEIAVELTQNINRAYDKANSPIKSVLAQAFFKRLKVKDGQFSSIELNAPFDFVCYSKASGSQIFNLAYASGDGGN